MRRTLGVLMAAVLAGCGGAAGVTGPGAATTVRPATTVASTVTMTAPTDPLVTPTSGGEPHDEFDTVVLLGDSLLWEATPYLLPMLGDRAVVQLSFSGFALCDGLELLPPVDPATLVVVSYTGNSMTPCMVGDDGALLVGMEVVERYRTAANELVDRIRDGGATVLLVGQPIRGERFGRNEIVVGLNADYEELAGRTGVHYVDAGASVENPDGSFAATLPCLDGEAPCGADGRNPVRSSDELHFCPGELDFAPCAEYSSGANRFALAIAAAIDGL